MRLPSRVESGAFLGHDEIREALKEGRKRHIKTPMARDLQILPLGSWVAMLGACRACLTVFLFTRGHWLNVTTCCNVSSLDSLKGHLRLNLIILLPSEMGLVVLHSL